MLFDFSIQIRFRAMASKNWLEFLYSSALVLMYILTKFHIKDLTERSSKVVKCSLIKSFTLIFLTYHLKIKISRKANWLVTIKWNSKWSRRANVKILWHSPQIFDFTWLAHNSRFKWACLSLYQIYAKLMP